MNDVPPKLPTISLPPAQCNKPGESSPVTIGGWGYTTVDGKIQNNLMCANTEVTLCKEDNKATWCAFKPRVDVCYDDTGSAVEYSSQLHGIILNTPLDKCEEKVAIAKICFYRQWIMKTMSLPNE